ncbi:hypothetical protein [Runella rosea]|nr:hypothetical protein [Runella rosea]
MYNLILSFEKRLMFIINMKPYKQGVILLICSIPLLIFTNPAFLYRFFECIKAVSNGSEYVYYEIIAKQSENIFAKLNSTSYLSHESNMQFRLFLPLLCKFSPFQSKTLFVNLIQLPLGVVFFTLLYSVFYKILNDKTLTFWMMVGTMGLYLGTACYVDYFGFGDFFAYLFLLISIRYPNILLKLISLLLAYYCDERALFGSIFVLLYFVIVENNKLFFSRNSTIVAISWLFYLISRLYLQDIFQLNHSFANEVLPQMGKVFYQMAKIWSFRFWSAFEGFNVLILLGYVFLLKEKKYWHFSLLILGTLFSLLFAMIALDLTRGITYYFVCLPIAIHVVKNHLSLQELKIVIFLLTLICLIHPTLSKFTIYNNISLM